MHRPIIEKKSIPFTKNHFFIFCTYLIFVLTFYFKGIFLSWMDACSFDYMLAFPFKLGWRDLVHLFTPSYHAIIKEPDTYHPLVTFLYFVNARWGGDCPIWMKIANAVIISGCSYLIFRIGIFLGLSYLWSFYSGLFYISYPVHTQLLLTPDFNTDVIMTFFSLIFILLHYKFRNKPSRHYLFLILVSYIAALFSKETAVILPLIIFVWDLLFFVKINLKERIRFLLSDEYLWIILITFVYFVLQFGIVNAGRISVFGSFNFAVALKGAAYNFIFGLKNLIIPDYAPPVAGSIVLTTISFFLLIQFFLVAIIKRGWRWPVFCFLWFFISALPFLCILPIKQLNAYLHLHAIGGIWFTGRYLAFFNVAFCWLLTSCLMDISKQRYFKFFAYALIILFMVNNLKIGRINLLATPEGLDNAYAKLVCNQEIADYSFKSSFFHEVILSSLCFLKAADQIRYEKARLILLKDFPSSVVDRILCLFSDTHLHKKREKVHYYNKLRKIRDPQKFEKEVMKIFCER